MRLFISINFTDEIKQKLSEAQNRLRVCADRGNFTRPENLHLTLVFLGEVPADRVPAVTRVMDAASGPAFTLSLGGMGRFRRSGGDTWWIGVGTSPELTLLYDKLAAGLESAGFAAEKRGYKPHLTLAREVRAVSREPESPPAFDTFVDGISLMLSERVRGALTYTEIHRAAF